MLNSEQLALLKSAINAETNAGFVEARTLGATQAMADWFNATSTTDAWNSNVLAIEMFDEIDVTKFDNLTAGKRDAWRLLMEYAPSDMRKVKARKAVLDVWGTTDSVPILQAFLRKATKGEMLFGGSTASTNGVSAYKLNWIGIITTDDIANALSS